MTAELEWKFTVEGSPIPKARPRFIRQGPRAGSTYTPTGYWAVRV